MFLIKTSRQSIVSATATLHRHGTPGRRMWTHTCQRAPASNDVTYVAERILLSCMFVKKYWTGGISYERTVWTHRWQSAPSYFARVQIIENGGGSGTAQKDAECGHIGGKANERALWTHRWQSVFPLPTKEGPALVPRGPPRRLQEAPPRRLCTSEQCGHIGGRAPPITY